MDDENRGPGQPDPRFVINGFLRETHAGAADAPSDRKEK